ncbi:hypothetical protein BG844_05600 [Couchioplanes caeruleus subsp. caeruleus]|uniref:Uncharacterized protein n=1 Tax=Couchioplanes caeruleus subsp. caeruleus TaxID=56427 RepID=A0A1K0FRA4_9ACTN|nr:hypothetical protein BG844_05600 [Couchioplanes caeruleus subsp. caeruleus]
MGLLIGVGATVAVPAVPAALLRDEEPELSVGRIEVGYGVALWRLDSGVKGERADLTAGDGAIAGDPGCYGAAVAEDVGVVVVFSPVAGRRSPVAGRRSPVAGCAAVPAEVWAAHAAWVCAMSVHPL